MPFHERHIVSSSLVSHDDMFLYKYGGGRDESFWVRTSFLSARRYWWDRIFLSTSFRGNITRLERDLLLLLLVFVSLYAGEDAYTNCHTNAIDHRRGNARSCERGGNGLELAL
ncbi:uncharacterized protein K489DRAFT_384609 [Dissoconium aciculare CBS 342.82]|uniref:Uncharacterized protein n=1 Tax=Dissoconium aciculare CBS 342.82 TaxID=1314786 RepID=A0A6J3LSU1_9PEZI|nr:uncharacterized protein K489DRAFT_384609 [Dissoconium aciculare CBS 342.82]KAF1818698.1 hypothetical protein K489DRAFT_384609 [Dissoconium aciculare CBS 342.82]